MVLIAFGLSEIGSLVGFWSQPILFSNLYTKILNPTNMSINCQMTSIFKDNTSAGRGGGGSPEPPSP